MRELERLTMEHYWRQVKGWATFRELYAEAVANVGEPAHFVEIGSWFGKSAVFCAVEIINSGKEIKLDCVDPWTDGGPDLKHKTEGWEPDALYNAFLKNIEPVKHIVTPVRMPSVEAAARYEDNSLDLVMIDGDHSYEAVCADIDAWKPKVKHGGILAGDDHTWSGVKRAVRDKLSHLRVEIRQVRAKDKGSLRVFEYWVCRP